MRIIFLFAFLTPLVTFSQYSTEYEFKCRFNGSLFKTNCEQLDLHRDSTYMVLRRELKDMFSGTDGRYYIKNDTITAIDDEINYLSNFSCRKISQENFEVTFKNTFGNSVQLDSISIFKANQRIKTFRKTNEVEFLEADSLRYFLQDSSYHLPINLTSEQQFKDIVVELPVRYFKLIDENTIICLDTEREFKKRSNKH